MECCVNRMRESDGAARQAISVKGASDEILTFDFSRHVMLHCVVGRDHHERSVPETIGPSHRRNATRRCWTEVCST